MKIGSEKIQTHKLLTELGLTDTEAHLYIAGLAHTSVTAQDLVQETSIKRPTVYHALHTLSEKGLVREADTGSKARFRMEPPIRLHGWLDAQKEALTQKQDVAKEIITTLSATGTRSDIAITEYTDIESVRSIFELALYARSKQCVIVTPSKEFLNEFDTHGARVLDAQTRGIEVRVEIRDAIPSMLITYDDTVAVFRSLTSCTVIASNELASIVSHLA